MAQYGLGENSPIKLSLGKDNYVALISRHGQFVRWRQALKCSCVTENNQPNIRCSVCRGTGYIYTHQIETEKAIAITIGASKTVTIPDEYLDDDIIAIYDFYQNELTYKRYGKYIEFFGVLAHSGDIVTIVFNKKFEKKIIKTVLENVGGGYYRIPGCRSSLSTTSGVYYTSAGDIVSVGSIKADGNVISVREKRQDMLLLSVPEGFTGLIEAEDVVWIPPFRFLILNQNFSKIDTKIIETTGGDAIMSYPYNYDVSDNDVITILSGTNKNKEVVRRIGDGEKDNLNAFFVADIDRVFTTKKEYKKGKDFALAGSNTLLWLAEDRPKNGEAYSVVYDVYPTYTVLQSLPGLRTSEDQRIPRRVVLKLMAGYAENKRVNQQ